MSKKISGLFLLIVFSFASQPGYSQEYSKTIKWQSAKSLTNESEKQAVQAVLDEYSCKGVPLIHSTANLNLGSADIDRFALRICREAKVAHFTDEGNNQLLILQMKSTGSCGDFDTAFLIENGAGTQTNKVPLRKQDWSCGGGVYKTGKTLEGDIFVVVGAIEVENRKRVSGDLKLAWNGTELTDISTKPHPR